MKEKGVRVEREKEQIIKFRSERVTLMKIKFKGYKISFIRSVLASNEMIQYSGAENTNKSLFGIPSKREGFIHPSITSQFPRLTAFSGNWISFWQLER